MEAARVLSQYEFSDTIRFIAFAGEEQGLWGSSAYAADAWAAGDDISAVINLDMIGYNPACDKVDFLGDPASDWLVNAIRTNASEYYVDIITEKIISASFTYSDHSSFWDYGYPAILGIEDYQPWSDSYCYEANENYHKVTDTFDAMNLSLLEKTTQLAVATIAELAGPGSVGTARTLYLPVVFPQWTPPGPVP
jgi:Zn-dependent M28 family amino/carboxypeptidase